MTRGWFVLFLRPWPLAEVSAIDFHQICKRLIFCAHTLHLECPVHHTNKTILGLVYIQIQKATSESMHVESMMWHGTRWSRTGSMLSPVARAHRLTEVQEANVWRVLNINAGQVREMSHPRRKAMEPSQAQLWPKRNRVLQHAPRCRDCWTKQGLGQVRSPWRGSIHL